MLCPVPERYEQAGVRIPIYRAFKIPSAASSRNQRTRRNFFAKFKEEKSNDL